MSDVTMVGLGAMGSALARAMLAAGHDVTVWNRTESRASALIAEGARGAGSLAAAVEASPLLLCCVADYDATQQLLDEVVGEGSLSGRTLVQLSTGSPREARALRSWVSGQGGDYLDGAIMPYPEGIGRPDARLLFAGPEAAWTRARPVLAALGGDLRYLGDNVAAAAVLDMAFLTYELCNYLAALHGARVCEVEGVGVDLLATMYDEGTPPHRLATVIGAGDFTAPGATLEVWRAALRRVQEQAVDAGINSEVPDLVASLFDRAIAAGHRDEDVAAVIEVLRCGG